MTMTVATFRQQFPAFSDAGTYDPNAINLYLNFGYAMLNGGRWGAMLDYGVSLFTAHYMVLQARDNATSAAGGIPGTVQGVQTSKSVDAVSVSYDTQAVTQENGGFWNMTRYGTELLLLARWMGSGGVQINGCINSAGVWP
jgi:hypothetical protein